MNETSVSSISTDWLKQSLSIKSDLPIFIDLLIDKSIPIFIDWLLRDISDGVRNDVIHFLFLGNFRLKAICHQQSPTWFFCGRSTSR